MLVKEVTVICPEIYPKKPDICIYAKMLDFFKLDIKDGSKLTITADGTDEEKAVNALTELFTKNYYLDIW